MESACERQAASFSSKRQNPTHAVINWLTLKFYHGSEMLSTEVII